LTPGTIYTVGQVNTYIQNVFETDTLLSDIRIKGEISNLTYHKSGHIYFTIKDSAAAIDGAIWRSYAERLKFRLDVGMKIVVRGKVENYIPSGKYKIIATSVEKEGEGDLMKRFLELKALLEEKGMFSEIYKKEIPKHAHRVGIVTAPTGAAIEDIKRISYERNPYIQLVLYPALVQGKGAAQSIVNGIKTLDAMGLDIIIAGRGGGSMEDLWAFNEEIVANAIFECNTPIISAVGHETDVTLADFVADARVATPSHAAALAVEDINDTIETINGYRELLDNRMDNILSGARNTLLNLKKRLDMCSPSNIISERRRDITDKTDTLNRLIRELYDIKKRSADEYARELRSLMDDKITFARHNLQVIATQLDGLSPLKKLSGGYSFVADDKGNVVTSIKNVKKDDALHINVLDGVIDANVQDVRKIERT